MRSYTVKYAKTPDWEIADKVLIDTLCWTDEIDVSAFGQAVYGDDALFVRLHADEKNIRMEENGPLGNPCEDSCLEFFLSPDGKRYFNIELNPNKCLYLGIGTGVADLVRLIVDGYESLFDIKTEVYDGGWDVYYKVPFEFIRRFFPDFKPAGKIRANMYKCGDKTVKEHYLSWNPMTNPTPAFHKPNDFGEFVFGVIE